MVKVGVYSNYGAMWTTNALLVAMGVGDAIGLITLGATNVLPLLCGNKFSIEKEFFLVYLVE